MSYLAGRRNTSLAANEQGILGEYKLGQNYAIAFFIYLFVVSLMWPLCSFIRIATMIHDLVSQSHNLLA